MVEIDFAEVYDSTPVALALLSPEFVFVSVNRAYEQLLGMTREDLVGRNVFDVFPGGPATDEAAMLRASMARVLAEGEIDIMPLQRYDIATGNSALQERYWSITNAPLREEQGEVCGIVNLPQEVTDFVRQVREVGRSVPTDTALSHMAAVEAHLLAQTNQLQEINQRLRKAQAQGRRTAEDLRKVVQQHREAVADTSHDLRGPITGLQIRLQDALADPTVDAREILLAALHDAERLGDIAGDLLELARLEGGSPVHTASIDLAGVVEKELFYRTTTITMVTRLEPGIVVEGSEVRLARLVGNLLANAERHACSRVEVTVAAEGDQAVLEVIDDGPGIPAEDRETVFRRFFRRSDACQSDPGGSGLGLPIARQIAQAHGGVLHAVDPEDPSGGARFVLRLPLRIG